MKGVVSISLLAYFLSKGNLEEILRIFSLVNIPLLLTVLSLGLLSVIISAYRWKVLIAPFSSGVPLFFLTGLHFRATFLSSILPGSISGDLYKIYRMHKMEGNSLELDLSVIVDRFIGLATLITVTFVVFCFSHDSISNDRVYKALVLIYAMFFSALILYLLLKRLFSTNMRNMLPPLLARALNNRYMQRLLTVLSSYRDNASSLLAAAMISVFYLLTTVLIRYLSLKSLHIDVNFIFLLFAVPLIFMFSSLPITIQGIGIREGVSIYFFSLAGLSASQVFAFVIIEYLLLLSSVAIGGILFAFNLKTGEGVTGDCST